MAILAAENENRLLDVLPRADFVRLERFLLSVREKCITEDFFSLKITCIVLFVMIRHIFFVLSLCTNALYDFYFHWLVKSSFLVSKGLLCIYNKQNNTRLLVDMEFLFSCFTQHLTRSLRSLLSYRVEHSKRNSISTRAHVLFSIFPIVSRSVCTAVTRVTTRWLEKFVDKVGSTVFDWNLYCVFATSGTITKADCPVNFTILKCGMSTIQPAWPDCTTVVCYEIKW